MSDFLLNPKEIAELTDVRAGKHGKTREQLQIEALRAMKIPFTVSAIGRPKVARAVIEGAGAKSNSPPQEWEPALG